MTEISRMLTLSTGHITAFTADKLRRQTEDLPIVYEKGAYGWFIYVHFSPIFPQDLTALMHHAKNLGCEWLCLDQDGPADPTLPFYDW